MTHAIHVVNTAFYAEVDGVETYFKVGDMPSAGVIKGCEEYFTQIPDDAPDVSDPRFDDVRHEPEETVAELEAEAAAAKTAAKPAKKAAAKKTAAKKV